MEAFIEMFFMKYTFCFFFLRRRLVASKMLSLVLFIAFQVCAFADDAYKFAKEGEKHYLERDDKAAIESYTKSIELCTNYAYAYYMRGAAHYKNNQLDKAVEDFCAAIKFDNATEITTFAYGMLGDVCCLKSNLNEAVTNYSLAIKADPECLANYVSRGSVYNVQGKFELGEKDYAQLAKLAPTNYLAYIGMGDSKKGRGQVIESLKDYSEAVRLHPTFFPARISRITAYVAVKDYKSALADFDEMARMSPTNAEVYANRSFIKFKLGRYEEGVADGWKALSLDSSSVVANNNLAWLFAVSPDDKIRDGKKAIELAQKACSLTGFKYPDGLGTLAVAYAEVGDFDEAVKWQKECIAARQSSSDTEVLNDDKERLVLFEHKRPYRDKR